MDLCRGIRTTQCLGNVFNCKIVEVVQDHCRALFSRQREYGSANVEIRAGRCLRLGATFALHKAFEKRLPAKVANTKSYADASYPADWAFVLGDLAPSQVHLDERLLRDLFCNASVANDKVDIANDARVRGPEHRREVGMDDCFH